MGTRALALLRSAAQSPDPEIRALVAGQWGGIANRAALPFLQKALRDPDGAVRIAAAEGLSRFGDRSGISAVEDILRPRLGRKGGAREGLAPASAAGPAEELRALAQAGLAALAIETLAQMQSTASVKMLLALRKDPSGKVRDAAAVALVRLGRGEDLDRFLGALESPDDAERLAATRALADIATRDVAAPLRSMAADPNYQIRAAAIHGLGRVGSESGLAALEEGLRDPIELVQSRAVEALEHVPGSAAEDLLRECGGRFAANAYMRLLAVRALARRGLAIDLAVAQRSMAQKDEDTRLLAVDVLEASGGAWAVELLESALGDPQPKIRVRAAAALVKLLQKKREPIAEEAPTQKSR